MTRTEIFDLLSVLGLRLSAATAQGCAVLGITEAESRVLVCLAVHGPDRPGSVGERVHASARRMTQVADGLCAKRLIVRRPDPRDARAKQLALTDEGERLASEIVALRDAWASQLLADLDSEDLAPLTAVLTQLLVAMDKVLPPSA